MSANLRAAALTDGLRRRRTVSVCAVLQRAKRGRFAYFARKLTLASLAAALPRSFSEHIQLEILLQLHLYRLGVPNFAAVLPNRAVR
jgi:hypothetical protein